MEKCVELGRTRHKYATAPAELEIRFYAASVVESEFTPKEFEQIAWVLPKELGNYDFLAANAQVVARLATGSIKPAEIMERAANAHRK
jgi:hypothetical protein